LELAGQFLEGREVWVVSGHNISKKWRQAAHKSGVELQGVVFVLRTAPLSQYPDTR
jgi:hypothetical protein